jgi:hypothetical protein
MKTLNGIDRQNEIMREHKKYQGEIAIIDKFLTTILSKDSKIPLIGEFIKKYIAVNYPKWYEISQVHINELAGYSENSNDPELYDKGKDCVYKTIGYCVNEELS